MNFRCALKCLKVLKVIGHLLAKPQSKVLEDCTPHQVTTLFIKGCQCKWLCKVNHSSSVNTLKQLILLIINLFVNNLIVESDILSLCVKCYERQYTVIIGELYFEPHTGKQFQVDYLHLHSLCLEMFVN